MLAILIAALLLLFAAVAAWFGLAMIVGFARGVIELPRMIRADTASRRALRAENELAARVASGELLRVRKSARDLLPGNILAEPFHIVTQVSAAAGGVMVDTRDGMRLRYAVADQVVVVASLTE